MFVQVNQEWKTIANNKQAYFSYIPTR